MQEVFLPFSNPLFKKGRDREVSHDIKHQLGCSIMIQICFLFIGKQEQREVTHDFKQGLEAILSRRRKFTETPSWKLRIFDLKQQLGGEVETSWNRKLQVEKTSILKEFCLINMKHETEFYNEV